MLHVRIRGRVRFWVEFRVSFGLRFCRFGMNLRVAFRVGVGCEARVWVRVGCKVRARSRIRVRFRVGVGVGVWVRFRVAV